MLDYLDRRYFLQAISGSPKQIISDSDIAVKCPICGDSKIHRNEKRLHLYEKGGITRVHCFNGDCAVGNCTLKSFLYRFYPALYSGYKTETFARNLGKSEDVFKSLPKRSNVRCFDFSQYFSPLSAQAKEYLLNRGFTYTDTFGKWFSGKTDLKIDGRLFKVKDALIIPLYAPQGMYGFYSRSLKEKAFSMYMHEDNIGYKVWNWFNVDKSKPVYIFEGIFDALSAYSAGFRNVIACLGASIPQERLNELSDPVFCLDNDTTGLKNALKYTAKHKVVVYNNPYKDCNEMMLNGVDLKSELSHVYTGVLADIKIRAKL